MARVHWHAGIIGLWPERRHTGLMLTAIYLDLLILEALSELFSFLYIRMRGISSRHLASSQEFLSSLRLQQGISVYLEAAGNNCYIW